MLFRIVFRIIVFNSVLFYGIYAQTDAPCNSPLTLRDDQFSATSEYNAEHNASAARNDSVGWSASHSGSYEYLMLNLDDIWEITSLDFKRSTIGWYTRSLRVSYSDDGYVWKAYNTRLSEDPLGELFERHGTITRVTFNPSIKARYLAINPVTMSGYASLLIELYGCRHTDALTRVFTDVHNDITIDTMWIPSQSPVLIDTQITVRPGSTLTVQAGVSVIFTTADAGLDVFGTLSVGGILGISTLFSSNEPVLSARSKWRGLTQAAGGNITIFHTKLRQATTGVQGNGSRVRIAHSEIHSCQYGIRLSGGEVSTSTNGDMADENKMTLLSVNVHDNGNGLDVHGLLSIADIFIGYSAFDKNDVNGIMVTNWDYLYTGIVVTNLYVINCTMDNNTYGIQSSLTIETNFYIRNSVFTGNAQAGFYYYRYYQAALNESIVISNSQFIENRYDGIRFTCYQCKTCNPLYRNNTFRGHGQEAIELTCLIRSTTPVTNVSVTCISNTFSTNARDISIRLQSQGLAIIHNNSFTDSLLPLKITSSDRDNSKVVVSGNTFTGHKSQRAEDTVIEIDGFTANITHNIFRNSSTPSLVKLIDGYEHYIAYNQFLNTTMTSCYLTLRQAYDADKVVNVDNNYWESSDMLAIKSKICDVFMDSTKAIAELNNFFPTSLMEIAASSANVNGFRFARDETLNATIIGGVIDNNLDLSDLGDDHLLVNRSLIVLHSASVTMNGVIVNFTINRGIVVHGMLVVGNESHVSGNNVLQQDTKQTWNGISIYSADVRISNASIFGTKKFLSVLGKQSTIVLYNCITGDDVMDHLVYAYAYNGNLSMQIRNSHIKTSSTTLYIRTNDTNILDISMANTTLTSGSYVMELRESKTQLDLRLTNLQISNSTLYSSRNWIIYISSCSSHLACNINGSNFSSYRNYDTAFFQFPSMDASLVGNTFGNSDESLYFKFCNELYSSSNFSNVITIKNNVFNSTIRGKDVRFYKWYTNEKRHFILIKDNIFEHYKKSPRTSVACDGYDNANTDLHSLHIESNEFRNSTVRVIDLNFGLENITITNNTFINNSQCIYVSGNHRYQPMNGMVISGNIFKNNTDSDGVIYIDRNEIGRNLTKITGNIFENNTHTIISLKSPNISINYNFFENEDAVYNTRVWSDNSNPFSNQILNGSLNYWGTNDTKKIAKKIYDHNYNEGLLYVVFRPYLGSRNISDIQDEEAGFVADDGEIGGQVNGNVTLTVDNSPYLIVSNVEIGENDTLTIDAGVVLNIKQDIGIKVYGVLNILGAETEPVKMLPEVTGSKWRGLTFTSNQECQVEYLYLNDTLEGLSVSSQSFTIHNITSTHSKQSGISVHIPTDESSNPPYYRLTEVTVSSNTLHGIVILGDSNNVTTVSIDTCVIEVNEGNGLKLDTNSVVEVSGCIIRQNTESGILLDQTDHGILYLNHSCITNNSRYAIKGRISGGIVLGDCNITEHKYGYFRYGQWRTRRYVELQKHNADETIVLFKNTQFTDNIADAVYIYTSNSGRGNLTITIFNSSFTGGNKTFDFNGKYYYWRSNQMSIHLINNSIENNTLLVGRSNEDRLIEFLLDEHDRVEVKGNVFRNNTAYTGVHISEGAHTFNGYASITENRFIENNFSNAVLDLENLIPLQIHRNMFYTHYMHDCLIKAPTFDYYFAINATHNYWGTKVTEEVVRRVCGFDKDMGKSYIWYMPFYEDSAFAKLSSAQHDSLYVSGAFGGEITRDVTDSELEFPYPIKITRSIMIRKGATLNIEKSVVLQFEQNRGIYVQGSLKLLGGDDTIVLENATVGSLWYGVIINSSSQSSADKSLIYNTKIQYMTYGVVTYSPNVEIKRSTIVNSTSHCLTLYQTMQRHILYDFEMSQFSNCSSHGLHITGTGNITIMNAYVSNSSTGISLLSTYGSVEIRSVNVTSTTNEAITVAFSDVRKAGNVTVENCVFTKCAKGVSLLSRNWYDHNIIKVSRNTFISIPSKVLNVIFPNYHYSYANNGANRTVDINLNTFENSCGIVIETWNNVNLTYHDNVISNAVCRDVTECLLYAYAHGNNVHTTREFIVSTNLFQNITSKCVVQLRDNNLSNVRGLFVYNQLIGNSALSSDGVVLVNAHLINISQNIFDNPDTSFDVYTELGGTGLINVTHNWWGSSDEHQVFNRIFDQRRDPGLIKFNVDSVLTDRIIDCRGVNNCSAHGECVSPDRCRCYSGWTGRSCTDYDCAGVNSCYGNGQCVAANTCECEEGWSGSLCIAASCNKVNNCSGHGICILPDVCTCAIKFTGDDCNSCVLLHWGSLCRPCPDCQHGSCDLQTGLCKCESSNWSGYLCDKCSETFYGPDCLPLTKIRDIIPREGLDKGGNDVHVWGHNFPETLNGSYMCKFGSKETNGTWLQWNHVVCLAPQHTEGAVILEISADGNEFTNDQLTYYFYATCPPGSCGRDLSPARGQCLFGGCSCFLPWVGDNCDQELLAPVIAVPAPEQTTEESDMYSLQLTLVMGSPPILWSILQGPAGMTLDDRTGLVSWKRAYARSAAYQIEARAQNVIGQDSVSWQLDVPVSYNVSVERIEPSGVIPVPRPVHVYGIVTFLNVASRRLVPIDIIVTSVRTGRETIIQELTDPLRPTDFTATYYPRPDDAGLFTVSAKHPGSSSKPTTNITWYVLGMRCDPYTVDVSEIILSDDGMVTVTDLSNLVNVGGSAIRNISSQVDGLPGAFIRRAGDNGSTQFVLQELAVNSSVAFDLIVTSARPLSGTIYLVFSTEQGTSARLRVNIKLSIQKPVLIFNPLSLKENIVRGTIRTMDVTINNIGEVAAKAATVSLPNDSRLSLVSFTVIGNETQGANPEYINIPAGGAAQMSIAIRAQDTAALGEMSGTIYLNSELSSSPISYKFYITSIQKFNVTFSVKDEYTYFAAGSPLVSNAKVTLVNPRRGYSETRYTSNETGYVVFEDIFEDQYSLYAKADGHSSYGAVILATSGTTEQDIFLQRVAVKYTWTVEPTTVEDVYIIVLESTFETYVPMPVVTIHPPKVNTIPLEQEETDTIEFNITNHGLIRADNVRFTLPTGHPYLNFELTIDFIGSIEANTSVIVPVKATLKNRTKRNAATAAICGLALLYDYVCGGTQTRYLDVTLTREYPGRPPLPCGLTGGGGGGVGGGGGGSVSHSGSGYGSGSGSSVTYNPTTPLSCDCAKTLIKSCALAYHPIAGCAIAVTDLGTSYSRSGGSFILGTLNAVLGLADTAMACVFGVVCSLCGMFYTTIRCIIDVTYNCDGARRRREISSEVVSNMLTTARPMDNFLDMMTEILGDEGMYNLETAWYPAFKRTVGDNSELGTLLSNDEALNVLGTLTEQASRTNLSRFLERWNNTAAAWENGTLSELEDTSRVISLTRLTPRIEQYLQDIENAADKGFDSIFDEFDHATNAYNTAEQQQSSTSGGAKKDGVCARVRVRIMQELVLTRDAFNARLEIENGETSDLEDISVEIHIKQTFGSGDLIIDKFSIGNPTLIGISGVDGTGRLGRDLSGSAEWLIIPYSEAAPEDDTLYDIGGRLSYSVDGAEFSVPLLPDTITVVPNPSLILHYFHEKYVRGDDALTPEVEPSIPFSLAVMVMNNGYGIARALKITSGQPEIIENEKGLLIAFKIIGAQLGSNPITPSLSVNFGDIAPFETKTARWLITSTLMGTFYNYSATFENINPLGDPQLSLMDTLGYHELIHLVRIEFPDQDDGLDDFLVNDYVDVEGVPDRLYNSANGTDDAEVYQMNITEVRVILNTSTSSKHYKHVQFTVRTNTSIWFYARIENTFTSSDPAENQHLLYADANDGREILVDKNVWQTTHILDTFYLQILDFVANNSMTEIVMNYTLIYGPRNMYAPRFNSSSYSATISKTRGIGFEIITVHAYDIDMDTIEFKFKNESITLFTLRTKTNNSIAVSVNESPLEPGSIMFELVVQDKGIPSKSSSVNVTILITDTNVTEVTTTTPVVNTTISSSSTNTTASSITQNTTSIVTTATSTPVTSVTNITSSTSTIVNTTASSSTTIATNETTSSSSLNTTVSSETTLTSKETLNTTMGNATTHSSTVNMTSSTTPTERSSSTTPSNGTRDELESESQSWVIPISIGVAVLMLFVLMLIGFVYALRSRPEMLGRSNSSYAVRQ